MNYKTIKTKFRLSYEEEQELERRYDITNNSKHAIYLRQQEMSKAISKDRLEEDNRGIYPNNRNYYCHGDNCTTVDGINFFYKLENLFQFADAFCRPLTFFVMLEYENTKYDKQNLEYQKRLKEFESTTQMQMQDAEAVDNFDITKNQANLVKPKKTHKLIHRLYGGFRDRAHWLDFYKLYGPHDRRYYEIVRAGKPCHAHLDIEWTSSAENYRHNPAKFQLDEEMRVYGPDGLMTRHVFPAYEKLGINNTIKFHYNTGSRIDCINTKCRELAICDCQVYKSSFHATCQQITFENQQVQYRFFKELVMPGVLQDEKMLYTPPTLDKSKSILISADEKVPVRKCIADSGVYRLNGSMRIHGCFKPSNLNKVRLRTVGNPRPESIRDFHNDTDHLSTNFYLTPETSITTINQFEQVTINSRSGERNTTTFEKVETVEVLQRSPQYRITMKMLDEICPQSIGKYNYGPQLVNDHDNGNREDGNFLSIN